MRVEDAVTPWAGVVFLSKLFLEVVLRWLARTERIVGSTAPSALMGLL